MLESLTRYQPRTFVPTQTDLGDVDAVLSLYQQLLDRALTCPAELEQWLLDRSELESAVSQERSVRYIRMTCQTDDAALAQAYRHFVETIDPAIQSISDKLDRKYRSERERFALDERRYEVYDRGLRADIELFREENVPLKTQESLLSQEYQKRMGAMTVEFDGQERTLPQMGKFQEEPDRPLRERAWRATAAKLLAQQGALEDLFDRMLEVRNQIAANAGCEDFREYQFRAFHRFDYSPRDCQAYHAAVQQHVVPLWRQILERRRQAMNLESLRPWDTSVDVKNRPPLKPFETPDQLTTGVKEAFGRLGAELRKKFENMDRLGLLDLASRKGKAPGGYQSTLEEARLPFIFMNAVGRDRDVRTLLHEGGHAFHALASVPEPLLAYRNPPLEFAEVASMAMELLAGEHLDVFYGPQDFQRSKREHLESIIYILGWIATVDAFQHWIYTHPKHSRAERRAAWLEIADRFSGQVVDWSGLEDAKAAAWHRQLHIFQYPFYYIEYGIAQLGALQLWEKALRDPKEALAAYLRGLSLGGSRPLPELFSAAGIRFDFSAQTIVPLVQLVSRELEKIG